MLASDTECSPIFKKSDHIVRAAEDAVVDEERMYVGLTGVRSLSQKIICKGPNDDVRPDMNTLLTGSPSLTPWIRRQTKLKVLPDQLGEYEYGGEREDKASIEQLE